MIKNRVIGNASWIIGCKIIQSAVNLIITMFTARYLGPSNYGIINYAASIVAFFVPIMQLGMTNILVQETVLNPEEEGTLYGSAIAAGIIGAFASVTGIFTLVFFVNAGDYETIIVCSLHSLSLFFQALGLIEYWYQAKYLSKYSSLVSLGAYLVVAIYKIILLLTHKSVVWFAVSNCIDHFIIAAALLIIYKVKKGQRFHFSWQLLKRILKVSRYYIVSGMMVTLFAQTDKIMLTIMMDKTVTGYYSAAVACAGITSFVFGAIITSTRPAIVESRKENIELFEKNMSRLYCIITYMSLAQSLFVAIFAEWIITLLYGAEYLPAVAALRIIVWYSTFSYYGAVRNIWILAEGKQKYLWIINLSGAVLNIILNMLLIPILSLYGAALASLITQFFTNVILGCVIKQIRRCNKLMLNGLNISILVNYANRKIS